MTVMWNIHSCTHLPRIIPKCGYDISLSIVYEMQECYLLKSWCTKWPHFIVMACVYETCVY